MADTRSRADKLRAMANDPGATQGERENARRILERMKEPVAAKARPSASGPLHGSTAYGNRPFSQTPRPGESFAEWLNRQQADYGENWAGRYSDPFKANPFDNWWNARRAEEQRKTRQDIRKMSPEEQRKLAQEILDRLERQSGYQPDPPPTSDDQWRHDTYGIHSWVKVGENTVGKPIHRCVICKAYDLKTHDPKNMDDHDWGIMNSFDEITDETGSVKARWEQRCRDCRLTRYSKMAYEGAAAEWSLNKED